MKKAIYLFSALALIYFIASPSIIKAETGSDDDPTPAVSARKTDESDDSRPDMIREKIREESRIQTLKNNAKTNDDIRNDLTKGKPMLVESRSSTTLQAKVRNTLGRQNAENQIRKEVYEKQKGQLIQNLNRAYGNLTQIRNRIQARIEKAESSGRVMTAAKAALVTADLRLAEARMAINALSDLSITPISSSTPTASASILPASSTTPVVDLAKPRQFGATAINSIKVAKKALNEVVVAIAKSMGLKVGQDGKISTETPSPTPSITPSVTPSPAPAVTSSPVATSTATTTP